MLPGILPEHRDNVTVPIDPAVVTNGDSDESDSDEELQCDVECSTFVDLRDSDDKDD